MKSINVIKIGNTLNISVSGKLYKKNCKDAKEANDIYKTILEVRENPTDENIKKIRLLLNEKTRIAMLAGMESDPDTGEVFLAGFNTPIPQTLVDVIKEYYDNNYPMDAIINFWKLLMVNPDVRVRTSLFDFITTHDFVLTDKGYMVVYKAVYRKEDEINKETKEFAEFISNQVLQVKKNWKCSPNKYVVYKLPEGDVKYKITKKETADGWDEDDKNIEILGNLGDIFNSIFNADVTEEETVPVYTDMYSQTMTIKLGMPVQMKRKECDSDPAIDCSYGLHCGATEYVERFANYNRSIILACLVNPANVVAVPNYDHSKMRVSEYFPFALATYENGKIDIIEQPYFEDNYCSYEQQELEEAIAKIKANELPYEKAINAEEEERPMSELMKIIESRLVDLYNID